MSETERKTVLCVWEIGGDLGHIMRFAKVSKVLSCRGYKVVVALRDLSRAYPAFDHVDAELLQSPVWLPKITMQRPIACLADSLLLLGYLEPGALRAMVQAWRNLGARVNPDLVIFNYAPTAMLGLQDFSVPKIMLGTGFAEPVAGLPTADWRPFKVSDGLVAKQEARVLATINKVQQVLGFPSINCLADVFKADVAVINAYEIMDPYNGLRGPNEYCTGPSDSMCSELAIFADNGLPNILVYIKNGYPNLKLLCGALAQLNANVFFVCPNGDKKLFESFRTEYFNFTIGAVNFSEAYKRIQVFVGHANANSATEVIHGNIPMLILPLHLEQLLIGKKMHEHGIGVLLDVIKTEEDVIGAINNLLVSESFRLALTKLNSQSTSIAQPIGLRIADIVDQLLGR